MERKSTGITAASGLILLCGILMSAFLVFLGVKYQTQKADIVSEITDLKTQITDITETQTQKEGVIQQLESEIAEWENLETLAAEMKTHFFDLAGEVERRVENDELDVKIAYLTFDDGPYLITPKFLDVLDEYHVLATFFQRGRSWEKYEDTFKRIVNSGHTIGNHTWTHSIKNGLYKSVSHFINDLLKNRDWQQEMLGVTTDIMRFPGGSSQARGLKEGIIKELRKLGYGYVDWDAETGDGKLVLSPKQFRDNVLDNTRGRSFLVVLMHDYAENTLKALPEIIEGLQKQGYIFLPLWHDSVKVKK